MYGITIFLLCLGTVFCYEARNANFMKVDHKLVYRPVGKFVYKACNTSEAAVLIKNLDVSPEPIQPGGQAQISADVEVSKMVAGNINYKLQLLMDVQGSYMDVCPYVQGYCEGQNMCAMVAKMFPTCPPPLVKAGFDCRCPVKPGNFQFPTYSVNVPELLAQVEGKFRVIAKLEQAGPNTELMCAQMDFCIGKCD